MRKSGQAYRSRFAMPKIGFLSRGAISLQRGCSWWRFWLLVPGPGMHIWVKGANRRSPQSKIWNWCLVTNLLGEKKCVCVSIFSLIWFKRLVITHDFYRLKMIAFSHQGLEGQYHLSIHRAPFTSWGNIWPTRKQTPWWSKPGGPSIPPFTRAYFAYILTHSVTQTPNWTRALKGPHRNSSSIVTGALTAPNNHIYPGLCIPGGDPC